MEVFGTLRAAEDRFRGVGAGNKKESQGDGGDSTDLVQEVLSDYA